MLKVLAITRHEGTERRRLVQQSRQIACRAWCLVCSCYENVEIAVDKPELSRISGCPHMILEPAQTFQSNCTTYYSIVISLIAVEEGLLVAHNDTCRLTRPSKSRCVGIEPYQGKHCHMDSIVI